MTEKELRKWRASVKARSEALDREVAKRLKQVSDAKAEEELLSKTDPVEWIRRLLLKHKFQRVIGVPSDFDVDRNDVPFVQSLTKALRQLFKGDARNDNLILKTILEVFRDLREEQHRRFLAETEVEVEENLSQLERSNPRAYKQLEAFARYSPQIDLRAVLRRSTPIPAALREHLAFLNQPSRHRYDLPTKKEVRGETIRRMRQRCGDKWTPPQTRHWGELFRAASLTRLPEARAGRPPRN